MSFFPPAIGAGIDIATTAQAQAGTDDTTAISPLKMREGFNASGSAPVFACRAWVNFDGNTTTPTIRASGNVSSVTRNGTGDYTVNFLTAMADNDYCFSAGSSGNLFVYENTDGGVINRTTGSIRVTQRSSAGTLFNAIFCSVSIFR